MTPPSFSTRITNCSRCGLMHLEVMAEPLAIEFAPPEAAPITWTHWAPCPTNGEPILFAHVPGDEERPIGTFDEALNVAFDSFDALRATGDPERDAFKAAARELFSVWKGRTP